MIYLLFVVLLLQNCAISYLDNKKTEYGDNRLYKTDTEYDQRFYTPDNIELLKKELNNKQFDNTNILRHKDAINIENRIEYSKEKNDREIKENVDKYVQNYKEMMEDKENEETKERITSDDYFNLSEYEKTRPVLNIATIKYLDTNNIMPMTKDTVQTFKEYYKNNMEDISSTITTQFNDNIDFDSYKNTDLYNINKDKKIQKHNNIKELTIKTNVKSDDLNKFY